MTRALLAVDVQNDFTEGGALGVIGGSAVAIGIAARLETSSYALVVASRDWHEADGSNGGHFAAPGVDPDFITTWPVHCVQESDGADFHPAMPLDRIDVHVRKGMGEPAYSAFEGRTTDGRGLAEVLRADGIETIDIAGIATDYCVQASALDAVAAGFEVRVLTDLIAGVARESSAAALRELAEAGVEFV